jgi:hypothetical protein
MERRMVARLMYRGVQAQVADQLLRAGEAADVADGRKDAECDDRIDACDGHQATNVRLVQRSLSEIPVDDCQLAGEVVEFVVMPQRYAHLVRGKRQRLQPCAALLAVDASRLSRYQVSVEDRLDLFFSRSSVRRAGCARQRFCD